MLLIDPAANLDIAEIAAYIADRSQDRHAARGLLTEFDEKFAAYARQPQMGDLRTDLGHGIRSFTVKRSYVVIYRELPEGIDVLRVFHGGRNYAKCFRRWWH